MNYYLLISALLCLSMHAMQTPPRPAAAELPESDIKIYTPTSVKTRFKLFQAIEEAIEGPTAACIQSESEQDCDQESVDPQLLADSPLSLVKKMREFYQQTLKEKLQEVGVTSDMLAAHHSPAKREIAEVAESTDALLSPASTTIKKAGQEMASRLGVSLTFRRAQRGIEAYQNDDQAVVDEQLLKSIANSPESLKVVAGHELGHKRHHDQVDRFALIRVLQQLSPTQERDEIKNKKCRSQEVFADLTPAALSPTLAKASSRVMERMIAQEGIGSGGEYPLHTQRLAVVQAAFALHEQTAKERKRSAARRNLRQELEKAQE